LAAFSPVADGWCRSASLDARGTRWAAVRGEFPDPSFLNLGRRVDAPRAAVADFLGRTGVRVALADGWVGLLSAGFWDCMATEAGVFVVRRPLIVRQDELGRLHCPDGPSIVWADGWCNYHLDGVSVALSDLEPGERSSPPEPALP